MSKRSYSDKDKATALAALDANGGNLLRTSKALSIPLQTLANWAGGKGLSADVPDIKNEKKEELADAFDRLVRACIGRAAEMLENRDAVEFKDLGMVAAIATDKMQLLKGQATAIQHNVNLSPEQRKAKILELRGKLAG